MWIQFLQRGSIHFIFFYLWSFPTLILLNDFYWECMKVIYNIYIERKRERERSWWRVERSRLKVESAIANFIPSRHWKLAHTNVKRATRSFYFSLFVHDYRLSHSFKHIRIIYVYAINVIVKWRLKRLSHYFPLGIWLGSKFIS